MKGLTIYRVLTFILLPIITLLGVVAFLMLLVAMTSPQALITVFIFACIVIYAFTSFHFLNKGIEQGQPCKPGLKDWIKVNAFGSFVFIFMYLKMCYHLATEPGFLNTAVQQTLETQQTLAMPNNAPASPELMAKAIKGMLYAMFGFAVLLLIHIVFTFYFLKVYNHLFSSKEE